MQRLEREASDGAGGGRGLNPAAPTFHPAMAAGPAGPALHGLLSGLAPHGPAVDPRSVHVQGVSPLAVPEVIGAHFSGCVLFTPSWLCMHACHQRPCLPLNRHCAATQACMVLPAASCVLSWLMTRDD